MHDILTLVAYAKARDSKFVHQVAWEGAGVWALLAKGAAGEAILRSAIDLDGFDFDSIKSVSDENFIPGALKYGGVASFITLCRVGETALKRSEAFLAEGQCLSLTGTFSWRVATDEITWSEQTYRIFELDQSVPVTFELIGSRVHPEDAPLWHEVIDRARGDGSDLEYEHRLQMPDQSIKYLHMVAHATRDEDGRLEYIGAVQDVTARRSSEQASCGTR